MEMFNGLKEIMETNEDYILTSAHRLLEKVKKECNTYNEVSMELCKIKADLRYRYYNNKRRWRFISDIFNEAMEILRKEMNDLPIKNES